MSAWMVSEESIAKIAAYMVKKGYEKYYDDCFGKLTDICGEHKDSNEYDPMGNFSYKNMFRALEDMNVRALNARYGDPIEIVYENIPQEPAVPDPGNKKDSVQLYKTMRCYLYQCEEGKVPDSDLYKIVKLMAGKLAADIVGALPEFEAAAWN